MKKGSFLHRLITCLVAGVVSATLWLLIGDGEAHAVFGKTFILSMVALSLAGGLVIPFVWQYLQRKNAGLNEKMYGWLYAVIRGAIAFDLSIFGLKKIFHMQFVLPDTTTSLPMKDQSGELLTWFYFGHSYAFGCILAAIQLAGSAMLLFRRTCLAGAILLFALLLNIALIDIFYQMNAGAQLQSIVMTIGTVFLILVDYDRLVEFFFRSKTNLQSVNIKVGVKTVLRVIMLFILVGYMWYQAGH